MPAGWLPAGLFEAGNVRQEARWAVQVYRGVLHALPASVRIWFGDLRDKAMASAFEVSSIFLTLPTHFSTAQAQQMYLLGNAGDKTISALELGGNSTFDCFCMPWLGVHCLWDLMPCTLCSEVHRASCQAVLG